MTDEKYSFVETNRDRARTARGAFARQSGARSHKVTMPSDYLTKSEKKKLNGSVVTMQLDKPMTYKEFKTLSDDLKRLYIEHQMGKYKVPQKVLTSDLFGLSVSTGVRLYKDLGIKVHRGGSHIWDEKGWTEFLNGGNISESTEEAQPFLGVSFTDKVTCEDTKESSTIPLDANSLFAVFKTLEERKAKIIIEVQL